MIDRDKVWTGDVNEIALGAQPEVMVGLYDTTLRDGEQTVGVVLNPEDKLEIARALDAAGIDRIEAGFPRVSADDWRAVELVAAAGLRAEVWAFSRAVPADVEALVELGVSASVIESPISDGKLDALGVSRETMLERIANAVRFATEHDIRVCFFGVDSSRADREFFVRAYETAVDAGAAEIAVVDTLGIATPEAAAFLVRARARASGPRDPDPLARSRRFRPLDGSRGGRSPGRSDVGARHHQRHGRARRERGPDRGGAHPRGAVRDHDAPRPRAAPASSHAWFRSGRVTSSPRGSPSPGTRCSHASRAPSPRSSTTLLRSSPTRRSSSARRAGSCSGRRAVSIPIRIKVAELGLDVPEERFGDLLAGVKHLGAEQRRLVTDDELRSLAAEAGGP